MKFTHGSAQDISNQYGNFEFELFDYVIDGNNNCNNKFINNGNDGEGAGIYACIGDDKEAIRGASYYSGGDNKGYLYFLDVDIEEDMLMHNRDVDEIAPEEWVAAIEMFRKEIRHINKYSYENFTNTIDSLIDRVENQEITLEEINSELKNNDLNIQLDEYSCPSEFEDAYEWREQVFDQYYLEEPTSYINDNGGSEGIVDYAIRASDNLYESLYNIWKQVAVTYTGKGTYTYNKAFQNAVLRTVGRNHDLTASYVDNDNFAVIFDTSKISVDRVIDFAKEHELENSKDFLNKKTTSNTPNKKPKI